MSVEEAVGLMNRQDAVAVAAVKKEQKNIAKAVELSGTEAGTIFVFDQASQEFQVQANHGMDDDLIAAIKDRHIRS